MDLSGAKLALHPALAALGVSSGTLTATIRDAIVRDNQLVAANFSASIGTFELPTNTPFATLLKLENPTPIDLALTGHGTAESVEVKALSLKSPLLNASASGRLALSSGLLGIHGVSGDFTLTEKGTAQLGPWLPLLTNGQVSSSTTRFRCSANSVACGTSSGELRIGSSCVALRCTPQ
jgi:hypothetical protein